ncbi:hypothetical protein HU200_045383 [Digitaria exilis]|uniref:Uncharacterized protein n=1 Tax=Digitaria exilis TaxID=1010633 RepID=A0A835A0Z2_9POAL|nr:hypothetical protein HU200_066935 [Digitaria exilis]KAF8681930.1 hypothetical protein HU200_045383 [Digitaria exilis]
MVTSSSMHLLEIKGLVSERGRLDMQHTTMRSQVASIYAQKKGPDNQNS